MYFIHIRNLFLSYRYGQAAIPLPVDLIQIEDRETYHSKHTALQYLSALAFNITLDKYSLDSKFLGDAFINLEHLQASPKTWLFEKNYKVNQ